MHPIHVSVCDISIDTKGSATFSFKIFYDDLQAAMGLEPGQELPKKYKGADQLINDFIQKNFSVIVDGKKVKMRYLESFSNPPAIWSEMTIDGVDFRKIKSIKIENSIMCSLYDDQKNLVNINIPQKKQTFALDRKNLVIDLKF